jgi:hypothetical protein
MNLNLKNTDFLESGIYGYLEGDDIFLYTLQHSYAVIPDGSSVSTNYAPKVSPGSYTCVRGIHQLEHGKPFETFMIEGVEGHSGILFHPGNFNTDSDGCVLVGLSRGSNPDCVLNSRAAFQAFMQYLKGLDQFTLTVE